MKNVPTFILSLLVYMNMVTVAVGQPYSPAFKQKLCNRVTALQSKVEPQALPKLPYTVVKYDLTLDWRKIFETHSPKYTGLQKITIRMTDVSPVISLDAIGITIDSIIIGTSVLSPTPQPNIHTDKLDIMLPTSVRTKGSEFIMSIAYRKDTTDAGFYYASKGSDDPYYSYTHNDPTLEDVAYTFSEPSSARNWMPCNDRPDNKAESEISIIVPNGIEAPSNGILVSKEAFTPTSTLWHWKSDKPIATYLMVADASNFTHWEGTHFRSSVPGDTVHLDYYAWQQDYDDTVTDGTHYNAQYFLSRNTSQIMTWLEDRFGPFPFVKYGQVAVEPFGGGMEHQTLTTIDRGWLKGQDEEIAHEMGHQWFGDKVTCDAFRDVWLNESFATFCEIIWAEQSGGYDFELKTLRSIASYYFSTQPMPMQSIITAGFIGPLTYSKGGCVIHMLRRMVGDSVFFRAIRGYLNTFAYSTATTEQFRDYMSSALNIPLTDYINQWIMGSGHPDYDFSWTQGADSVYISVNQLQKQRDHFIMPLHFFAYHNGGIIDTLSFNNIARSERFKALVSYKVDSMGFDDDASMISIYRNANGDSNYHFDEGLTKQFGERAFSHTSRLLKNDPTLTVLLPKIQYSDFRVTVGDDELTCSFEEQSNNTSITISNTAGMKLIEAPVAHGEQIKKVTTHLLPSGMYFVRLGNETQKVAIVK
ncbi:MAG TPA: M1 family aminopeptidase [Candidatus Kapabacteria bacterium]|nr:M1 family aminopeptidase [Candidatus Kapabacteria bacterium]